jgi:radical SAM-linked protein
MSLVKKVRKTGFTMAVEAGSQRLRNVINKNIIEEDIFHMVENAFGLGWKVVKLYFMIGLPGETLEDLEETLALVRKIHKIKGPKGRKGKINVSVNTFIPKSHTPFQWSGQLSLAESRDKIEWMKRQLRLPGLQFKWQNPENSFLEGLWARGDRRLTRLLISAYEKGCRFDGWSDQFLFNQWMTALEETGIDADFFVTRKRELEEPLPWDHIDNLVGKPFLKDEWKKALTGTTTPDCRDNQCALCGVCRKDGLQPKLAVKEKLDTTVGEKATGEDQAFYKKLTITYSKQGPARFFGHLEMVNVFLRAIRRARIPVTFSQGFHPLPKVSFDDPLPLGAESMEESFQMRVPGNVRPEIVVQNMNKQLPEGLHVHGCRLERMRPKIPQHRVETWEVHLTGERFDGNELAAFQSSDRVVLRRQSRKGKITEIDLKEVVRQLTVIAPGKIKMVISLPLNRTVRPLQVVETVFSLRGDALKTERVKKLETVHVEAP